MAGDVNLFMKEARREEEGEEGDGGETASLEVVAEIDIMIAGETICLFAAVEFRDMVYIAIA